MFCPFCGEQDTKVIDSRLVAEGTQVRRRRSCPACHERFTSFEVAALEMPQVIKRDGRLVVFSEKIFGVGWCVPFKSQPMPMI